MRLLETGKIVTTHGIRGEVRAEVWSDRPEQLVALEKLFRADGTALPIEYCRVHKGALNLKITGFDDINSAMSLIGTTLYLNRDDIALAEGTYFIKDLIGLLVVDSHTGDAYGELVQVQPTGANDVYHVRAESGRLLLVPAIPQVIREVDLESKRMLITPLKGLFDQ